MRRALRSSLPALALHFGLHPWDVDLLTFGEIETFMRALETLAKEG
jgi:hypothetical protein